MLGEIERGKREQGDRIEIIRPGEEFERSSRRFERGRVRIVKLGPVAGALLFVLGLAIFALVLSLFAGAFLILFPVGFLLGAGAYIAGLFGKGPFRLR